MPTKLDSSFQMNLPTFIALIRAWIVADKFSTLDLHFDRASFFDDCPNTICYPGSTMIEIESFERNFEPVKAVSLA